MLKDKELSMVSGANLLDDGVSWFKENPVLGTVVCVAAAVATAGAIYYVAGTATVAGAATEGLVGASFCETYIAPAISATISLPV